MLRNPFRTLGEIIPDRDIVPISAKKARELIRQKEDKSMQEIPDLWIKIVEPLILSDLDNGFTLVGTTEESTKECFIKYGRKLGYKVKEYYPENVNSKHKYFVKISWAKLFNSSPFKFFDFPSSLGWILAGIASIILAALSI